MTTRNRKMRFDGGKNAGLPFARVRSFTPWFLLGVSVLGGASVLLLWETVESFDLAKVERVAGSGGEASNR
ncbi:hypothetical protein WBP07_20380 (plasmid) [Novosphingobium sp. BL-8A]|uniref:hypothetical protein n=1 Tax=Novosphingobium sp. BL-8A TaxID=3127639 RepID=UPI0037574F16